MLVRVLYAHNPLVSRAILMLYACELVAMSLGTVFTVPRLEFDTTCNITHSPPELLLYWYVLGTLTLVTNINLTL